MSRCPKPAPGQPAAQAFSPSTARRARIASPPSSSARTPSPSARIRRTAVSSWIVTPRSSSTRRNPRASLAGWIEASDGTSIPPRNAGEAQAAWTSAGDRRRNRSAMPSDSASSRNPSPAPSCAGDVLTTSIPPGSNHGSTSWVRAHSPIRAGATSAAFAAARPASTPNEPTRAGSASHQPVTKPPLRPLAPPPTMSRSTIVIPSEGSRSRSDHAVHSPVNPPPTTTTSAVASADGGGHGVPGSCSRASRSHQARLAPGSNVAMSRSTSRRRRDAPRRADGLDASASRARSDIGVSLARSTPRCQAAVLEPPVRASSGELLRSCLVGTVGAEHAAVPEDVQQRHGRGGRQRVLIPAAGVRMPLLEQGLESGRDRRRVTNTIEPAQLLEHEPLECLVVPRVGADLHPGPQDPDGANDLRHGSMIPPARARAPA